jgi:uncharacterized cupin superfamily protein
MALGTAGRRVWPAQPLKAEQTGLTLFRLRPGRRSPFSHRHKRAAEIYVILQGTGKIKLDDELIEVHRCDAIRVAPGMARAFEAGTDGLEFLAIGSHTRAMANPSTTPGSADRAEPAVEHGLPGGVPVGLVEP